MLFIVSPAKKMADASDGFAWRDLPRFLPQARELLEALRALSYEQAKALWRCSDRLAELNWARVQEMRLGDGGAAAGGEGDARRHAAGEWLEGAAFREADGAEGSSASSPLSPALFSYEGIQYQNIAPRVLSADALEYLQRRLRILSGLYGVLRPFDGVAPYRLEMQAKLSVGGARDLYGYWGDALAESLAAELSDQLAADPCESPVLVNLASVEYAKAAVPHAQAAGVRVLTCLFGTVREGRLVQRPTEAKAARGTFARWCAEHAVESEADLARFDVGGYALDEALCAPGTFVFTKR